MTAASTTRCPYCGEPKSRHVFASLASCVIATWTTPKVVVPRV